MTEIELAELIESYGFNKSELDSYKKICDKQNSEIKTAMSERKLSDFDSDTYSVKYTVKTSVSFDEDKLLDVIKTSGRQDLIKTKEYVDTDALESALYHGEIPQEVIAKITNCQNTKRIPTLTVKTRRK